MVPSKLTSVIVCDSDSIVVIQEVKVSSLFRQALLVGTFQPPPPIPTAKAGHDRLGDEAHNEVFYPGFNPSLMKAITLCLHIWWRRWEDSLPGNIGARWIWHSTSMVSSQPISLATHSPTFTHSETQSWPPWWLLGGKDGSANTETGSITLQSH